MTQNELFATRMKELYRQQQIEGACIDMRRATLVAMADVFIGPDFDFDKIDAMERLQTALDQRMVELYRQLECEQIRAGEYVDAANDQISQFSRNCEQLIGSEDFRKLFDVSAAELTHLIDKDTFLATRQPAC